MVEIAKGQGRVLHWGTGEVAVALLAFIWVLLAAFWAAPASFTEDGFIYQAMLGQTPFRLDRPEALTALVYFRSTEIEPDLARLVATAFAEGRPVFVRDRHFAEMFVASGIATGMAPRLGLPERSEFYRLTPPYEPKDAR